jgi:hypothetical protein
MYDSLFLLKQMKGVEKNNVYVYVYFVKNLISVGS